MEGRSTEGGGGGGEGEYRGEEEGTLRVFKTDVEIQNTFLTCLQHSFAANWKLKNGMFLPKMWKASLEEC